MEINLYTEVNFRTNKFLLYYYKTYKYKHHYETKKNHIIIFVAMRLV